MPAPFAAIVLASFTLNIRVCVSPGFNVTFGHVSSVFVAIPSDELSSVSVPPPVFSRLAYCRTSARSSLIVYSVAFSPLLVTLILYTI